MRDVSTSARLVAQEANPRFFEHYLLRVRLKEQMAAFASLVPNVGEGPDPLQSSVIAGNREPSSALNFVHVPGTSSSSGWPSPATASSQAMLSSREDASLMPPSPLLRPSSPVNTDAYMNT